MDRMQGHSGEGLPPFLDALDAVFAQQAVKLRQPGSFEGDGDQGSGRCRRTVSEASQSHSRMRG